MRSAARSLQIALVLLLVTTMTGLAPGTAAAEAGLPAGFALVDMPSGQDELLTDVAFAPDGSYVTTGKNGRVAWVSADGRATTLAELPVVATRDLGLAGVALAADHATSRRLYLARTTTVGEQTVMRLSSWALAGEPEPTSLTDERVLWDLPVGSDVHAMTDVATAPDGTLFVTIGDSADHPTVDPKALRALDVDQGYGKLVHVTPDGAGVPTNPFYDPAAPSSWRSRVYASGFRSPFRVGLDPVSGAPVVGDVGWNSWEEVDLVRPGSAYGWPCWEGRAPTPGYADLQGCQGVPNTEPLWTYPHGPMGTAVTGGTVYTGASYPEQYRGAYFFGDYASQRLYTLRYDDSGQLVGEPEAAGFGAEQGAPVSFATAANGDVVYADIVSSRLQRLVHVPGNRAPTARAVPTVDAASRTVTFDGSTSSDLDGDAVDHRWDFGDGATGAGPRVTHTYAEPATAPVTARLTVTDPSGEQGTAEVVVVPANAAPVVSLTAPAADRQFAVGEPVEATATAVDREDGELPVRWSVVQVHCGGGYCHDHPGESFQGGTFAQPFDDHGDATQLVVVASATDRFGVVTEARFTAQPRLRVLTLTSATPSALTVDGSARAVSQVTVGARVAVAAPALASDGVAGFDGWDDGGDRERTLVMPDADVTLTAVYRTPIERRFADDAALRALLGEPTGPEVGDAALRYREHTGGRLYWTPDSGVHEVHGLVLAGYLAAGGSALLGAPVIDEAATPDGVGRHSDFERGVVYWTPDTGAHEVHGLVLARWQELGREASYLGYPTSDEYDVPGGRRSDFQRGSITWDAATDSVVDEPSGGPPVLAVAGV
ncbi:PQQ-dependent sugar dehydrogenase [Modestobacter sp. URMC 112]